MPDLTGCTLWEGLLDKQGYARRGGRLMHRVAYETACGPIPPGLVLDHTCHNGDLSCPGGPTCPHRRCVNPAHLEPVTQDDNRRRSHIRSGGWQGSLTECKHGHLFTPENTYIKPDGRRSCRACNAKAVRRYKERNAAA